MRYFKIETQASWDGQNWSPEFCAIVQKPFIGSPVLLSPFGIGWEPGDVFDFCPLKSSLHGLNGGGWRSIVVEEISQEEAFWLAEQLNAIATDMQLPTGTSFADIYCYQEG